ncbi:MAG: cation transporter [Bacilli bacterium]|nr:cation transporter [Bacilli bacterium]
MDRFNSAHKASILGILGNILLLVLKTTIGFISNSQAMIADAFNSFGDVLSSLLTFIGNKISSKKADNDHHLGHGKAEYIYAFLISIIMLMTSVIVIKGAITTYLNHSKIDFSISLIIICIITIITKFSLYLYTRSIGKKHHNILVEANSKDHRNDCFITMMTLTSAVLGVYVLDIIIGIIIALWIAYTALKIFKESYDVLMDKAMDEVTEKKVHEIIQKHSEVLKIQHFNSTPVGYKYQISFTIFVDGNLSTFESHEIADTLEKEIKKEIPEIYLSVIHVNPMNVKKKDK